MIFVIFRETLKWHGRRRRAKLEAQQEKRSLLFEHIGVSLLCAVTAKGLNVVRGEKERALVHPETAPPLHARNSGLCV